jgi:hypothetical protein
VDGVQPDYMTGGKPDRDTAVVLAGFPETSVFGTRPCPTLGALCGGLQTIGFAADDITEPISTKGKTIMLLYQFRMGTNPRRVITYLSEKGVDVPRYYSITPTRNIGRRAT